MTKVFEVQKNIHIVSSPLQLMNCIEAIHHFSLSHNILIIYFDNKSHKTLQQLEAIKGGGDYREGIIHLRRPLERLSYYLFPILVFFKLHALKNKVNYVFLGYPDYFITHIINFLNGKTVFFVDDGVATLFSKKNKETNFKDYCLRWKQLLLGYKIKNFDFQLFTVYKNTHNNLKAIKHEYSYFRSLCKKKTMKKNVILFIGQPLNNFIDSTFYIQSIDYIVNFHDTSKVKYIPHRHELDDLILARFCHDEAIEVIELKQNIELWLLEQDFIPEIIYTFVSSAAINIKIIFPEITIKSIYIPEQFMNAKANRKKYELILREFVSWDIALVNLPNS